MLLSAKDIVFSYDGEKKILDHADFQVESGEVVGLVAPSGFGKSTLGKILAGYIKPDAGEVTLDGKPLPKEGFCPVQLIFQHPEKAVNPKWKMKKVLTEAYTPTQEYIKKMGIKESWMNRWPAELSGGELQRFCVLRALAPQTKFIIADEMTTMLDVITQAQIWENLLEHAKKNQIGVVVISHEKSLIKAICTRVVDLTCVTK